MEPPPLPDKFFEVIRDESEFREFVRAEYVDDSASGCLRPMLLRNIMQDAYQCYTKDTERLGDNMLTPPDHFKHAGFIAYWLRRHNPVYGFKEEIEMPTARQEKTRDFIKKYGNVFLAFSCGYKICFYFEQGAASASEKMPVPDKNYIESICYLMKYKNVSPHSLGFIYRSLFFGFRDPDFRDPEQDATLSPSDNSHPTLSQ